MLGGLEVVPRKQIDLPGRHVHRDGRRRGPGPPPRGRARRRAGPHQRARLPQRQALAGHPGAARRRHRRSSPPSTSSTWSRSTTSSQQITGVPQRETVPDAVVRRAEQIELVDMTPEALRRRMAHGNIYQPEKIDAALGNYFRVGNLTALRELALLWLADKVDDQLDRYRAEHGIAGHLGDPGAGRRRAHRRPRGRHADPPGGPDRRPRQGRRPARRARHPQRRAGRRRRPGQPGPAAHPRGEPRRHLPPGGRRRHPRGAAGLRPRRQRHPARARRQPPRPVRPAVLARRRGDHHRRVRPDRRAPGHPRGGQARPGPARRPARR